VEPYAENQYPTVVQILGAEPPAQCVPAEPGTSIKFLLLFMLFPPSAPSPPVDFAFGAGSLGMGASHARLVLREIDARIAAGGVGLTSQRERSTPLSMEHPGTLQTQHEEDREEQER